MKRAKLCAEEKQGYIDNIIGTLLKPNTYGDEHPNWIRIRKALNKLNGIDLSALYDTMIAVKMVVKPFDTEGY
jgi:hypothetical protein